MLPSLARAQAWTDGGIEVTLVDPHPWLYYSGMVPEHLGGVYEEEDIRIDLVRFAREADARFIREGATAIAPDERVVTTESGTTLPFDVLAIDVGGVNPAMPAAAVATKPISRIRDLAAPVERTLASSSDALRLIIVGGGAAGVEVALNITGRFQGAERLHDLDLTIVEQADRLLPGFPEGMQSHVADLLHRRGVSIHLRTSVSAVDASPTESIVQTETSGTANAPFEAEVVLWATGTVGPPFLRESGLPTDDRGFLHVTRQLRTRTHPRIFAAGDCATLPDLDLAKVGVHAVKQGPDLRDNLERTLDSLLRGTGIPSPQDLGAFRPYPVAPLILSTGEKRGLWTAGPVWAARTWCLRLKHWIDRRWIRPYAPERWGDTPLRDLMGAEAARSEPRPNR